MKEFTRPTQFYFENAENLIIAESQAIKHIRADDGTLIDIHVAPTLNFSNVIEETGEYILEIDPDGHSDKQYKKVNDLTYSIGKLIRLAELNYDLLEYVIGYYFRFEDFMEVINKNKECKKLRYEETPNFSKLTFGNLRNIFSCILKSDERFHNTELLRTHEERSYITKLYNDYIVDRDYFTHGILFLKYPDFEPVLRVKIPGEEQSYVIITNQVLYNNLEIHEIIMSVLDEMRKVIDTFSKPTL